MQAKLTRDDGTGRTLRATQGTFLDWVEANREGPEVLAGQLPTGVGKSMIASILQRATGAVVIVPSNILMDDTYIATYPTANFLKGKTHYQCNDNDGLTCHDVTATLHKKPCPGCPYTTCRDKALRGEATFFNPMSLFYLQKSEKWKKPDMIVVDEAHQLKDMILLITSKQFRASKYNFPSSTSEVEIVAWMQAQLANLHKLFKHYLEQSDRQGIEETSKEIESIGYTLAGLEENPQNYVVSITQGFFRGKPERYLNVAPLDPPRYLVKQLLECKKLILLSATLSRMDVESLLQGTVPYKYVDMASPIDKSRRTVRYRPTPFALNFKTEPAALAAHIEKIIREHPGKNAIVHVSYAWAEKLAPHFKLPVITHTTETKNAALATFKQTGGVLIASGMSEGIDLRGDLCRLNIIPMLIKMNPYDPAVKKRLALKDGQRWYDLEQIKLVVQQAGRSTRGEDDESTIVVCDPSFPSLILKNKADVPKSFYEAIKWSS